MLREADGVQWVALPAGVRFDAGEVVVRTDRRGDVTVQARRKRPVPTEEEIAAFWARIDAFKTGGPEDDWPDIEPIGFGEDKDLDW